MKEIHFDSEKAFDDWVSQGHEIYAVYDCAGDYLCDVEEPMFVHLLDSGSIDADTRCLTEKMDEDTLQTLSDYIGTKIVIGKTKGLSFRITKDSNAPVMRRFILSVRKDGTCVEAPRFQYISGALSEVENYMEEYEETNVTIEISLA